MKFPPFELERIQSLYENSVEVNLTESGVEPLSLKELMNGENKTYRDYKNNMFFINLGTKILTLLNKNHQLMR